MTGGADSGGKYKKNRKIRKNSILFRNVSVLKKIDREALF
jgi:hypothetical protein